MDLDDDSLDDLLADTSANKFKKTNYSSIKEDAATNSEPPVSRREKKSALLAELFGPSSSTSFGALNETPAAYSSNLVNNEDEGKTSGGFGSMEKTTYSFSTEPVKKAVDNFSLGGYTPSGPRDNNKSRPSSSGSQQPPSSSESLLNSHTNRFYNKPDIPATVTSYQPGKSLTTEQTTPKPTLKSPAAIELAAHPPALSNVWNVQPSTLFTPPSQQQSALEPSFYQPQQQQQHDHTNTLNVIKDILETFSTNFCSRLQTVTVDKSEGLGEITNQLTELQKCISTAASDRNLFIVDNNNKIVVELEKKMSVLENRIEALNQENVNLKSRLEHLENQVREGRSETMRVKAETDSLVENSVKWMKETVNSFDSKLSNYSSSMLKQVEEVASSSSVRQIQERLSELENARSKGSNQQEEQVLHLLKAELKWLQRQKEKLKSERKENSVLQKQIVGKLQLMQDLSAVIVFNFLFSAHSSFFFFCDIIQELSHTARDLHSQTLSVDVKIQKMEQKWTKLLKKEEDIQAVKYNFLYYFKVLRLVL